MSEPREKNPRGEEIEQQAAAWVVRCDRGLTPAEQDDFSQWLATDPRHGAQLARHRRHWQRLDKLVQWRPECSAQPNPDLLAPPPRPRLRWFLPVSLSLAAAAAVFVAATVWRPAAPQAHQPSITTASPHGQRVLPDGSIVELNRGAVVTVHYIDGERRVRLEEGEAHFTVTKDPARPFIVTARGFDVRALGTAFNVRLEDKAVEVLVTEGHVQVGSPPPSPTAPESQRAHPPEPPLIPRLEAQQRAVVSLLPQPEPPRIATLTPGEIARVLSWQHRLLNFTAAPLAELVAEFNRRNAVQLVLIDSELAAMRISATFRSDNIDGFLRLLEAGFGVRADRRGESEILLRKAR